MKYIKINKCYVVRLATQERERLDSLVNRGREAAYRRHHARILLLADEGEHGSGLIDGEVAERVGCTRRTGVRRLVQEDYPQAQRITLVMGNLNTHTGASLYKAFPPALARSLLDMLEFVYTPKHGSWLKGLGKKIVLYCAGFIAEQ